MAEKKLSKKALNKSFRNWFYGHLTCFSQEHMQTFGYLCAMLPLVEELYDTREEQTEALKTYSAFFNTEPQLGTVIVGMTAGLEEAKANGEDIDGEMINGIRAGLMGPVAGIGDSLLVGTLIPILLGVALGMSSGGSPLGAIFYIIAYNVILPLGMRLLYFKGYELGGKAVEMIVGKKTNNNHKNTSFIGWLDPEGRTDIYVNLRCMHIEDKQLTLYAGGGLLASSELNDEWLETEKKLQTIKRLIAVPPLKS